MIVYPFNCKINGTCMQLSFVVQSPFFILIMIYFIINASCPELKGLKQESVIRALEDISNNLEFFTDAE